MQTDLASTLARFDYALAPEMIAQTPTKPRDAAKLMVINRDTGAVEHDTFHNLPNRLTVNDVLVINETKVVPARMYGKKVTGGKVEVLLLTEKSLNQWWALTKPGLKPKERVNFMGNVKAKAVGIQNERGEVLLEYTVDNGDLKAYLNVIGATPIPPYIHSHLKEKELRRAYQTVYAHTPGSVAAPTAGLHFTESLLRQMQTLGVTLVTVDLHIGGGTFLPLTQDNLDKQKLHEELFDLSEETAKVLTEAKKKGKRILAVGTTTTRALESAVVREGKGLPTFRTGLQRTHLFIKPPYQFAVVDGLITNFHLPRSSLLMLVAAFASWPQTNKRYTTFQKSVIGKAYQEAIDNHYRFYSFGDASLII